MPDIHNTGNVPNQVNNPIIQGGLHMHGSGPQSYPPDLTHIPAIDVTTEAIGRETAITGLHKRLHQSDKAVVVRSIGGMGKTTLVKAYVAQYRQDYDHVAWIGGAENLVQSVASDTQLHQNLGLTFGEDKPEDRYCQVMLALNRVPGNNLLVIDNAEASLVKETINGKTLAQWFPGNQWKKIATSREHLKGFEEYKLEKLEPDYALQLFRKHYKSEDTNSQVLQLIELVDYHTLTLEILAKTLANDRGRGNMTLAQLCDRIANHHIGDADLQRRIELEHPGSDKGIYMHLLETFEVGNLMPEEKAALQLFLLLPPEGLEENAGHPLSFFLSDFPLPEAIAPDPADAFDALVDKGWLERDDQRRYKLHRLLREVLMYRLKPSVDEAESFIRYTAGFFDFDTGTNFPKLFPLLPFGDAVELLYADSVHEAVFLLQNQLGEVYRNAGNLFKASRLLEASLKNAISLFGESHRNVATSRANLANVYGDRGHHAEAAELLEAALASDLASFGETHPNIATHRSNLGNVYRDMDRNAEAAELLESALASDIASFGEAHTSVATRRLNLAKVYYSMRRHAEAAELLESALASGIASFGESHSLVATYKSSLGEVYRKMGRTVEAAALLESALASDLANFGEAHFGVATDYNNLALIYRDTGHYQQALEYFQKALTIFSNAFGDKHPYIDSANRSILSTIQKGTEAGDPTMLALQEQMKIQTTPENP